MTSFNRIQMADGSEFSLAEWYHQPRFSTIEFAQDAAVSLRCFNYTNGQRVSSVGLSRRNATERDTNVVRRNAMNQDEALLCFSLHFEIFALTPVSTSESPARVSALAPLITSDNLRRLQRDCLMELFVGAGIKKPQWISPFAYLGQSMGVRAWASGFQGDGDAGIGPNYGTAGDLHALNQQQFSLPIYIGGFGDQARPGNSTTFYGQFRNGRTRVVEGLNQDIRIIVNADGLLKRPA